jgi:uncharacterized protein
VIVDAHCHAGTGDGFTGPWDTLAPIEPYLEKAAAAGIGRTIVFPVFNRDYDAANRRLAAIVARHPDRLVGFGGLHPIDDAGRVDELVREAVEDLGLRGLKIHAHDALPEAPILRAARRHGIPVLVDVMRKVEHAIGLARAFPEVPIIVPHLGAFADDWHAQRRLTDALPDHPNLFADTSGVRYWDVLVRAARRAPDRLIFGSDGPFLHPAVELEKIRQLPVTPDVRRAITGGTIERLVPAVRTIVRYAGPAQAGRWTS